MKKYSFVAHFRSNERGIYVFHFVSYDIISAMNVVISMFSHSFVSAYMTDLRFDDVYE